MASWSSTYWLLPETLYTLVASNRLFLASDITSWVFPKPFGKSARLVWAR